MVPLPWSPMTVVDGGYPKYIHGLFIATFTKNWMS